MFFVTGGVERIDYIIGMDAQAGQDVSADDAEDVVTGGMTRGTQLTNVGKSIMTEEGRNIKTGATSAACAAW